MARRNSDAVDSQDGRAAHDTAVEAKGVSKAFGATVALDNASFSAAAGTVHALLGENGAGKSTLVKLLSGLLRADSGTLSIFGSPVEFSSPRDAHARGLQTAFQELTLVPELTVAENMLMPYQPVGAMGQLRRSHGEELIAADLRALGVDGISPRQQVRGLSLPLRQKLEIARAVRRRPTILLLDEPTSALTGPDVDWLGGIIERIKAAGGTVIFISHRLDEVRRICDALTVLRNGRDVGSFNLSDITDDHVIQLIVGRELASAFPECPELLPERQTILSADRLAAGRLEDASFNLTAGEIVGIAGLQGMGQLDLFLALFGDIRARSGAIAVGGEIVVFHSPKDAIEGSLGIGLVPEGRSDALFPELDGRINISLPSINRFVHFGVIDTSSEVSRVASLLRRVHVDLRALFTPVHAFSGGNQQKMVLAKWLLTDSRILLLYDPTRGVDIETKHEMYLLINEYVRGGGAVLLYSTDIEEIANLSHRILVVYGGRVTRELDRRRGEISQEAIIRSVLGERTDARGAAQ